MKKIANNFLAGLYFIVYCLGYVLNKIARLQLALSYVLLLEFRKAKDVIKYLFMF